MNFYGLSQLLYIFDSFDVYKSVIEKKYYKKKENVNLDLPIICSTSCLCVMGEIQSQCSRIRPCS